MFAHSLVGLCLSVYLSFRLSVDPVYLYFVASLIPSHILADEWQIGLVWLPSFLPHVGGVYMTVKLAQKYPNYQWLMAAVGLSVEGISR